MPSTESVNGRHETPRSAVRQGTQDEAASGNSGFDPLAPILLQLTELLRALREYAMTWTDQARIALQVTLYKAAFALVIGLAGFATLVISTSLLLIGAATGIGLLAGGQLWIGQIVVGAVVFAVTFTALAFWRSSQSKANWKDLQRRYEHRPPSTTHDHAETSAVVPE